MVLFIVDNNEFTGADLEKYIQHNNITEGTYYAVFNNWIEEEITNMEDARLEEKYPEFRYLLREYHDGILLFNISEEKIWNYAVEDSVGLEDFYNKNKDKYYWEERFKGFMAVCKSIEIRDEAEKYFDSGMSVEEVKDMLNDSIEMIVINQGAWEKGRQSVVDYFVWNGPEPEHFNQTVTFVRGDIIPPEPKSLDEARGLYISDYQNYLEKRWLKELRKKYKIKVKRRLLRKIENV
jgi:peptidyl-prolyl cis-trans isomerase SurA